MPVYSLNQRLRIALGGFVTFTGFMVLLSVILSASGAANLELVFQNGLAMAIAAAAATLNIVCGVLLVLRNKKIVLSFATHQEKTDNNSD